MTANSKILDAQPISEREDRLLQLARDATVGLAMHATHEKCEGCKKLVEAFRAVLALYKDRP